MTVNELIEMLKNYPGDTRVLTLGYEGGLNDVDVKLDSVVLNYNNKYNDKGAWYYGPHEYEKYVDEDRNLSRPSDPAQAIECVIIKRGK